MGALPSVLPPLSMPTLSFDSLRELFSGAVAVTLLALTEAVSIARAMAVRSGQHLDGNQEFIGQGLSNIIGSFFSGYVATGSFNRSGLNYTAGAKTPMAAITAGVLLAVIVVLVAPLATYLPNAAMAGVLFLVAWGLIDFHHIRQIISTSRAETAILLVTFVATLSIALEEAIVVGVMLSLVIYLSRTSRPQVVKRVPDPQHAKRKFTRNPALPECPQMKIVRVDGSLFFGAVSAVQESFRQIREANPVAEAPGRGGLAHQFRGRGRSGIPRHRGEAPARPGRRVVFHPVKDGRHENAAQGRFHGDHRRGKFLSQQERSHRQGIQQTRSAGMP